MSELIKNNTSKVNFSSISGQVAFDENGESTKILMIEQFQGMTIITLLSIVCVCVCMYMYVCMNACIHASSGISWSFTIHPMPYNCK